MSQTLFIADRRPKYDINWAIVLSAQGGTLGQALRLGAEEAVRTRRRVFVHELTDRARGLLFWRKRVSEWLPRYSIDANHNTVASIARWGIDADSIDTVDFVAADRSTTSTWLMKLPNGSLVTVRRWPPRLGGHAR